MFSGSYAAGDVSFLLKQLTVEPIADVEQKERLIQSGRKHYSSRTIVEYLRHQTLVREATGVFKINDHAIPDLARLWQLHYPKRERFFEFRQCVRRAA